MNQGGGGEGGNESYNLYKISQLVGGCPIILIRRDRITGKPPILQRAANKFDFLALPLHNAKHLMKGKELLLRVDNQDLAARAYFLLLSNWSAENQTPTYS